MTERKKVSNQEKRWINKGRPMTKEQRKSICPEAKTHENYPFEQLHKRKV